MINVFKTVLRQHTHIFIYRYKMKWFFKFFDDNIKISLNSQQNVDTDET